METSDSRSGLELLRLTRRCRSIDKYVSTSTGLTVDEMHCLSTLFSERPPSVKRLSELINVNPTRTSKILRELEQRGFVTRTSDAIDHRKEQVILTDTGCETVKAILSLFDEVGSELLGCWRREFGTDFSWLVRTLAHTEHDRA